MGAFLPIVLRVIVRSAGPVIKKHAVKAIKFVYQTSKNFKINAKNAPKKSIKHNHKNLTGADDVQTSPQSNVDTFTREGLNHNQKHFDLKKLFKELEEAGKKIEDHKRNLPYTQNSGRLNMSIFKRP